MFWTPVRSETLTIMGVAKLMKEPSVQNARHVGPRVSNDSCVLIHMHGGLHLWC